jgi:hypothetical protein
MTFPDTGAGHDLRPVFGAGEPAAEHGFNARLYFDSIAGHGGPILIDREVRGWSQGLADTT